MLHCRFANLNFQSSLPATNSMVVDTKQQLNYDSKDHELCGPRIPGCCLCFQVVRFMRNQ